MPNQFSYIYTVLFQTIQFSLNAPFKCQRTVLFQTIQFSISALFSSTWPIDRNLSGTTTPDQTEPLSNDNKGAHSLGEGKLWIQTC